MIATMTTPNSVPKTLTWPPASDGAADHRSGEGKDQPVVADRGLAELQARDQHDPGERGEKAGNRVR